MNLKKKPLADMKNDFIDAVLGRNLAAAKFYVCCGVDPDDVYIEGTRFMVAVCTAIVSHSAIFSGHYELVTILLECGASPNKKDAGTSMIKRPLESAVARLDRRLIEMLINAGASIVTDLSSDDLPYHFVAIQEYLKRGTTTWGNTEYLFDTIELLIENGLNIEDTHQGRTILDLLCSHGHITLAGLVIKKYGAVMTVTPQEATSDSTREAVTSIINRISALA